MVSNLFVHVIEDKLGFVLLISILIMILNKSKIMGTTRGSGGKNFVKDGNRVRRKQKYFFPFKFFTAN